MALRLKGSTSGYVEIDAPAVAGDNSITLPTTAGEITVKDASGNTSVGDGVNFGNPGTNIFTINTGGSERLRIGADGAVSIGGTLTYEDVTSVDAVGLSTFRDGLNTKDVGITTISSTNVNNGGTAVDIFVYDTSKDSDGGEWRKRTQHTSWYNETLNTATRGSRREFPAVAVIVAETGKVTIYDGDDPDLPMWMVFNGTAGGASHNLLVSTGTFCLSALNGTVFMGALAIYVNFISEYSRGHRSTGGANYWNGPYNGNIAERNAGKGSTKLSDKLILGGSSDVAMTVLPNAPIDSATGLPIPTIAVATDGGVSVIKDDGIVVDFSHTSLYNDATGIQFLDDNSLILKGQNSGAQSNSHWAQIFNIPSSDESASGYSNNTSAVRHYASPISGTILNNIALTPTDYTNSGSTIVDFYKNKAFGYNDRLTFLYDNVESPSSSSVAYATTSYNTGWMHGDIKGAFLSDTSTADVVGGNLVTNGTFTGNINDWTVTNSAWAYSSDRAASSTSGDIYQNITTVAGEKYIVSVNFIANSSPYTRVVIDDTDVPISATTTGVLFGTFTASSISTKVAIRSYSSGALIDDVIVTLAEEDRSVNNKGLQVFGEITKSAVAGSGDTAAELVAYSGFSASDYLQQPYNSDLDFGTGDLSISFWYKMTSTASYQCLLHRGDGASGTWGSGNIIQIEMDGTNLEFQIAGPSFSPITQVEVPVAQSATGQWQHFVGVRSGGVMSVYIDSVKYGNVASTQNATNTSAKTWIGERPNVSRPASNTSMTLFRMSASAPSAEQIKKMYEDEKVLFQENAACTLYGSSDAVTALAYDEITDQLHVGTSSGRSDFQGLRRINNTTDPVSTAISAHDTFIIEQ